MLPLDVMLTIYLELDVGDVLNLRLCSKALFKLSLDDRVWRRLVTERYQEHRYVKQSFSWYQVYMSLNRASRGCTVHILRCDQSVDARLELVYRVDELPGLADGDVVIVDRKPFILIDGEYHIISENGSINKALSSHTDFRSDISEFPPGYWRRFLGVESVGYNLSGFSDQIIENATVTCDGAFLLHRSWFIVGCLRYFICAKAIRHLSCSDWVTILPMLIFVQRSSCNSLVTSDIMVSAERKRS